MTAGGAKYRGYAWMAMAAGQDVSRATTKRLQLQNLQLQKKAVIPAQAGIHFDLSLHALQSGTRLGTPASARVEQRKMKPTVARPDESKEFTTTERCTILEVWNDASDPGASIARARVAPGVTTQPHRLHGVVERYLIIEGSGFVRIGGSIEQAVAPGDIVVIPAKVTQQITNTGESDLVFYCVCSPRFTPECYESLE